MAVTTPPARRRVALPETTMLPRVGKVRLGELATSANGKLYPRALGHFVVRADESGITSEDAAAAFRAVYPGTPTELRVLLPGHTAEDVLEGANRLYGAGGKLKRKCDGETCDERTATGGWDTKPCVCDNLPENSRDRCALRYTLNVLLPDVPGLGVWQVETGSVIGVDKLTAALRMLEQLQGTVAMTECVLRIVPVSVSPDGKAKTVHVLDLAVVGRTPRQVLAGEARQTLQAPDVDELPALPAPALDEERDHLIDPTPDEQAQAPDPVTGEVPHEPIGPRVEAMLAGLSDKEKVDLSTAARKAGVKPSRDGLIAAFGDQACDIAKVREEIALTLLSKAEEFPEDDVQADLAAQFSAWLRTPEGGYQGGDETLPGVEA